MLKTPLTLSLLFLGSLAFAQTGPSPAKPPVDRAKLPPNLRNLPLERMSSGALMLLNRDNNLVLPPRIETTAKGATITQEAVSGPVALDLRIGPNIRLGNDPSALPPNMRAQAEPHIARAITNEDFLAGIFQEGRFATGGGAVDCGYSISHDGGLTWTRALIPNLTTTSGGPYSRATDPVVAFDLNNNVYLETLVATTPDFTTAAVVLSKSTDGGATFASPTVAYQPGSTTVFPDKEWMAINTFGNTATAGRILVTFSLFSNVNATGAPILRTYSTDTGFTWNTAVLQDPAISLFDSSNHLIASNDNWTTTQQAEIQASGYAPGDSREPAIVRTLAPGAYTAVVRGINATSGAALLEVHDLDPSSGSLVTNMSTRGVVGTNANVMIRGFIVGAGLGTNGDGSSEVLIRALGRN